MSGGGGAGTVRDGVGISIVIPTYNEASTLPGLLAQLDGFAVAQRGCEVIVVDGGSTDGTPELVTRPYRLVRCSRRGRGRALNEGAAVSHGEVVFFLHSDSVLQSDPIAEIVRISRTHRAGCFGIRFDTRSPVLLLCQWFSNMRVTWRNLAYGDQGMFVQRDLFFSVGGFPDVPLMEDLQFSFNLKQHGVRFALARTRITTSSRRFGQGELRRLGTWLDMVRLRRLFNAGACPEELAVMYGDAR